MPPRSRLSAHSASLTDRVSDGRDRALIGDRKLHGRVGGRGETGPGRVSARPARQESPCQSQAGWGQPLPDRVGRGIALQFVFATYMAAGGRSRSGEGRKRSCRRVVCAVDCGTAVNPDTVRAQIQSGIIFGITAALYGQVTLKDGRVEQTNFDSYQILRMNEAPAIDVHIVPGRAMCSCCELQPLPVVADQFQAIAPGAPVIHHGMTDNLAFDFTLEQGEPAKAFAEADVVIGEELRFERQMAMTLEPRGLIADFNPSDGSLTVIHAHQSPFQMQEIFANHLGIPEHKVRVVAPDIGGGFGLKLNVHCDEIATVVASVILGRPVKLCAQAGADR
jgi:molybdopterin-binding aldehyde dehydrogenase-like protein